MFEESKEVKKIDRMDVGKYKEFLLALIASPLIKFDWMAF